MTSRARKAARRTPFSAQIPVAVEGCVSTSRRCRARFMATYALPPCARSAAAVAGALQAEGGQENWCGVLQEVALPGAALAEAAAFLPAAAAFANDKCYGNLSCSLFVHPRVCAPGRLPPALRQPGAGQLALQSRTACAGMTDAASKFAEKHAEAAVEAAGHLHVSVRRSAPHFVRGSGIFRSAQKRPHVPARIAAPAAAPVQRWTQPGYLQLLDSRRCRPPSCNKTVHVHVRGEVMEVIRHGVPVTLWRDGCRWRRPSRKRWRTPSRRCGTGACASTSAASWASASPSCPGGPSPATSRRWGCILRSLSQLLPSCCLRHSRQQPHRAAGGWVG